jgi:hypothetical protein
MRRYRRTTEAQEDLIGEPGEERLDLAALELLNHHRLAVRASHLKGLACHFFGTI